MSNNRFHDVVALTALNPRPHNMLPLPHRVYRTASTVLAAILASVARPA